MTLAVLSSVTVAASSVATGAWLSGSGSAATGTLMVVIADRPSGSVAVTVKASAPSGSPAAGRVVGV